MAYDAEILKNVPLFALLDADERTVLAAHVDVRGFEQNLLNGRAGEPISLFLSGNSPQRL